MKKIKSNQKPKIILGINSVYHESSACIIEDGKIVAAAEEERFNRIKHAKPAKVDNPHILPINAIRFCLNKAKIEPSDIDFIGYSFNPEKRLKNIGLGEKVVPGDWGSKEGEIKFYQNLLKVIPELKKLNLLKSEKNFYWIDHHLCHAGSSFFVSPFKKAAVIAIDGIGEFSTTWLGYGQSNKLKKVKEIEYPSSLGFLWEKVAKFLGFTEYDACKIMGLVGYGDRKKYYKEFRKIVKISKGNFEVDNKIWQFRAEDGFEELEKLFGPRRIKCKPLTKRHADIAAGLQKITEEILLSLTDFLFEKTGFTNLCLAGGVALNCLVNAVLQKKSKFSDIYISSAPHDAGTSLGAAYYVWCEILGNKREVVFNHPYLGSEFSDSKIEEALKKYNVEYKKLEKIENSVAQLLVQGKVIAWFQGKAEFGPRALGNRSLLADPRNLKIKDYINGQIKHRENFRPYAPAVLEEKVDEWFEIPKKKLVSQGFMLFAYPIKKDKQNLIPAVSHVDGTSRLQIVSPKLNPKFYNLIKEFQNITGIPLILNTSLNIQEPIVNSPDDAIKTFLKSKIDYLAIGNYLVFKKHKNE